MAEKMIADFVTLLLSSLTLASDALLVALALGFLAWIFAGGKKSGVRTAIEGFASRHFLWLSPSSSPG